LSTGRWGEFNGTHKGLNERMILSRQKEEKGVNKWEVWESGRGRGRGKRGNQK